LFAAVCPAFVRVKVVVPEIGSTSGTPSSVAVKVRAAPRSPVRMTPDLPEGILSVIVAPAVALLL
jgi:hypothetical protein